MRCLTLWGLAIFPCWLLSEERELLPLDWSEGATVSSSEGLDLNFSDAETAVGLGEEREGEEGLVQFIESGHYSARVHIEGETPLVDLVESKNRDRLFTGEFSERFSFPDVLPKNDMQSLEFDLGLGVGEGSAVFSGDDSKNQELLALGSQGVGMVSSLETTGEGGFFSGFNLEGGPSLTTLVICFTIMGTVVWNIRG